MLIGPVFTREVITSPRSWRHYFSRSLYVSALFGLVVTAWLILMVHGLDGLARFGSDPPVSLIAPLQMAMAIMFSALLTAAAVAQEKDRRTLDLLLMTNMTNAELVLGQAAGQHAQCVRLDRRPPIPLLMFLQTAGRYFALADRQCRGRHIATAAAVAGSLGSMVALWREKTFQSLALTALAARVLGAGR